MLSKSKLIFLPKLFLNLSLALNLLVTLSLTQMAKPHTGLSHLKLLVSSLLISYMYLMCVCVCLKKKTHVHLLIPPQSFLSCIVYFLSVLVISAFPTSFHHILLTNCWFPSDFPAHVVIRILYKVLSSHSNFWVISEHFTGNKSSYICRSLWVRGPSGLQNYQDSYHCHHCFTEKLCCEKTNQPNKQKTS